MTNDHYLIFQACLFALNKVPNTRINHPMYRDTYALANRLNKLLTHYEEIMNLLDEPIPNTTPKGVKKKTWDKFISK